MLLQGHHKAKDNISKPVKLCDECNDFANKLISIIANGCHSSEFVSLEYSSKATTSNAAFIRQTSTNFAMNTKLVMTCQMSCGVLTLTGAF